MYLTRHETPQGPRWALDKRFLPCAFDLGFLLQLPKGAVAGFLRAIPCFEPALGKLLPPVESTHEIWASGVTYLRSREAREAESTVKDVYARVYEAKRPELFWKAVGWRVVGHEAAIRVRDDSRWNVPEPELTLVVNSHREVVGYCVGNDVSSRDIEGENPLYLPQAKVYEGSCALGPGIMLADLEDCRDLAIQISLMRDGRPVFEGATRTSQIKRPLEELVEYLGKELDFPRGVFLLTGTGIIPPHDFSMQRGDIVRITIGALALENPVSSEPRASRG
jgi:2-dehydro-3-deoxy-D-arabinonate dehydratase